MTLRSLLFVPGDSERKLAKALHSGADALILDLEDSVSAANKEAARRTVAAFLDDHPIEQRRTRLWVRINPLDDPLTLADLTSVLSGRPDGVMLPKANGPGDVQRLAYYLDILEQQAGGTHGSTQIIPVVTETARAPFALGGYSDSPHPRLAGLTWGAEDLSTALGASTNLAPSGGWASTYMMVRSMTLLAAHSASVLAIETLYSDFNDTPGLLASCRSARAEGFTGRIAIHPRQVEAINEGFSPSTEEIDQALRVISAFAAAPESGTIGLDGRMLDRPHLVQAERLIALHGRLSGRS